MMNLINILLFLLLWLGFNLLYIFTKKQILYFSGIVVKRNDDILQQWSSLIVKQTIFMKTLAQNILSWYVQKQAYEKLQSRKKVALIEVVNHLNQTLSNDLGLKTTHPATTDGTEVWVYLVKKLDENSKKELEDYFIGVLVKYTTEFALNDMSIEMYAGAGWIAKFDVQEINVATYNRMARASEVENKEDFEDVDLW